MIFLVFGILVLLFVNPLAHRAEKIEFQLRKKGKLRHLEQHEKSFPPAKTRLKVAAISSCIFGVLDIFFFN